ncbi:UNVERIFIED_CONTAM: hypothetical protein K2H54_066701 [Gekko kuhli]
MEKNRGTSQQPDTKKIKTIPAATKEQILSKKVGPESLAADKMATRLQDSTEEAVPITSKDLAIALANQDKIFLDHIATMSKPFYEQLDAMQKNLHETNKRQNNLKLKGLGEKIEENGDLATHLSAWLGQVVSVEEDLSRMITKAYRLGPVSLLGQNQPET